MALSPREQRFINCLLKRPHSRKELGDLVGSLNVCDVKYRLVNKDLDIRCKRIEVIDRDGRKTRPGIYYLPGDQKEKAKKMVERVATQSTIDNQNGLHKQTDGSNCSTNSQ